MKPPASLVNWAFGRFELRLAQRSLLEDGHPVRLSSRAMDLLAVLLDQAGEVVTKNELIARVWPQTMIDEAGLRVHIAALRKALGDGREGREGRGDQQRLIANVPQRGYCFVAPVRRLPAGDAPAPEAAVPVPTHIKLPPRPTRLIGREAEVQALVDHLPQRRFVSLVGPGGMGKTTAALAAAERLLPQYPGGVYFVDLASLADEALVPGAVAAALGVPLQTEHAQAEVAAHLAGRLAGQATLLLLDNCEHVIAAAAAVAEWLIGSAPNLSLLATSREALRARGEWVQRLGSLDLPPFDIPLSFSQALDFSAFELFVERALASCSGLDLGDADVASVSQLCRQLDGMPLAIELVAARIDVFGLRGLIQALNSPRALPLQGHRTAFARQQTLKATLDWSHALLGSQEQRVLHRLSVFRDRFDLDAALALTAGLHPEPAHALMTLVAKSLVCAEAGGGTVHYRLLETTRSHAAACLAAGGDSALAARRHAEHCLQALQAAAQAPGSHHPSHWRSGPARLIDDVRAALSWCFGIEGDPAIGAALAAASAPLWFGLWRVREYIERLEQALARLPPDAREGPMDMQLSLAFAQACIAMRGAAPEGLAAFLRCVAIAERLGDAEHQLRGHWGCFSWHSVRGDHAAALAAAEAFGQVAQRGQDTMAGFTYHRIRALCQHYLGDQRQALHDARLALHPSTLDIHQLHGSPFQFDHRSAALTQLARILWLSGQPEQAQQAAEQAVAAAVEVDHALSLCYALSYAACPVALWSGDEATAQRYVDQLRRCSEDNSLVFWQTWPRVYTEALALRRDPAALPSLDETQLHGSHLDMLATLDSRCVSAIVVRRWQAGQNAWCGAEVQRVLGERAAREQPDRAEALLRAALATATQQGANAWLLRAATSLARWLHAQRRSTEAQVVLRKALALFDEGEHSADLRAALALVHAPTRARARLAEA